MIACWWKAWDIFQKIVEQKEIFDWSFDDSSNYMLAIGEELYETGKVDEGREWFENWLEKEPHNQNALNTYS